MVSEPLPVLCYCFAASHQTGFAVLCFRHLPNESVRHEPCADTFFLKFTGAVQGTAAQVSNGFNDCFALCDAMTGCTGFTYTSSSNPPNTNGVGPGTCGLKNRQAQGFLTPNANAGLVGAVRANAFSGTVTYSPVPYTPTTRATAGGTTNNGAQGSQTSNTGGATGSGTTGGGSQGQASSTTATTPTTLTTLTTLTTVTTPPPAQGSSSPTSFSSTSTATAYSAQGTANNFACSGTTSSGTQNGVTDANQKKYNIGYCGSQLNNAGSSVSSSSGTFNQCFDYCDNLTGCKGFTWTSSTSTNDNTQSGTCALYTGSVGSGPAIGSASGRNTGVLRVNS